MKLRRTFIVLPILFGFLLFLPGNAFAQSANNEDTPLVLCLPGIYLDEEPLDCVLMGPAEHLTQAAYMEAEIASISERYPHIDPTYGETQLAYLKITEEYPAYIYYSLEDAINGGKRETQLPEGNAVYVSYIDQVTIDKKNYYELANGDWIRGGAVSRLAEPNMFRGVLLNFTPERKFGWVLHDIETRSIPGYYSKTGTGHILERYSMIEVWDEVKIGKSNWYMVASGEWLFQTEVALVYPTSFPPTGISGGRWIEINLFEQTLAVYNQNKLVFATLVTTGANRTATRPGTWKIYEKHTVTNMAGGDKEKDDYYSLRDVPWTMYFDDRRAMHAEYWHDHLGYRSSHGCVNLSFPDAQWLFDWGDYGDWVYVWDPSGQTSEE